MICQVYYATWDKSHSQPSGTATALLINGFLLEKAPFRLGMEPLIMFPFLFT